MSEKRILKLQPTASGGEPLIYEWPLIKTRHYDAAAEIIETIEMVMEQYQELRVVMQRTVKLRDVDVTDYDAMKQLCDKYNRAAKTICDLWRGATRPGPKASGGSEEDTVLRKIIQRSYNRAVEDPSKLNHHYEAWSSETYGETTFHRCQKIIEELRIKPSDVIVDLGSGVGQVVVHMAAASRCKKVIGIEKAKMPATFAVTMKSEFERWMKWHGKKYQPFELIHGDFMEQKNRDLITKQIKKELLFDLGEGVRIVSTKAFCPVGERRLTERHMTDLGAILNVKLMTPVPEPTSWTCNTVDYWLHTVNRGKLEKYFSEKKQRSRSATASPDSVEDNVHHPGPLSSSQFVQSPSPAGNPSSSSSTSKKNPDKHHRSGVHQLKRDSHSTSSKSGTSSSRESSEKPDKSRKLSHKERPHKEKDEGRHRKLSSTHSVTGLESGKHGGQPGTSAGGNPGGSSSSLVL